MGWPYQDRWSQSLAVFAFIFLTTQAAVATTSIQTPPDSTSNSGQSVPETRASDALQVPTPDTSRAPEGSNPAQSAAAIAAAHHSPEELGDELLAQHHYQAALEAYQKDLNRSAEVWNKMGIAYQLMFNHDAAMHCYQSSLRLDPKNSRVMNNLGTIYDAQREYGSAERLYHKALKAEPKSALIYKNLGTNLLAQHKYNKGWEAYQTALKLDPAIFTNSNSPRVQNPASVAERGAMNFYMAKGCVRAGMTDCAIEYLRMALNEGFTNPKKIEADSEFAALKSLPAFQELLDSQRRQ